MVTTDLTKVFIISIQPLMMIPGYPSKPLVMASLSPSLPLSGIPSQRYHGKVWWAMTSPLWSWTAGGAMSWRVKWPWGWTAFWLLQPSWDWGFWTRVLLSLSHSTHHQVQYQGSKVCSLTQCCFQIFNLQFFLRFDLFHHSFVLFFWCCMYLTQSIEMWYHTCT